jgi:lipoprotein NlpD
VNAPAAHVAGRRAGCHRPSAAQLQRIAILLAALIAAGCARLDVYNAPSSGPAHVVRAGDTLYKIAFQYNLRQADLVRWNGLRDPDTIYVGQRIRLSPPSGGATAARAPQASTTRGAARRAARAPAPPADPPPVWAWPTDGPVVMSFGSRNGIATGIGIGGRVGQRVVAAAAGHVVYAGSGLAGYGQLLIVRHNNTYLTAYGHLDSLLVAEGQDVARGQAVAEMGTGPERQARLHFEVRRNGTPVDPLRLLRRSR